MKLKIETVELKHKNIFGKEVVERKVYHLVRTSLFGLIKRYIDFAWTPSYWSSCAISDFLESKITHSVVLRKHNFGIVYFDRLEEANAVLNNIKENPDKYIIK